MAVETDPSICSGYFSANREPWLQFPSVVDFTSLVALEEVRFPKEHTWPDSE